MRNVFDAKNRCTRRDCVFILGNDRSTVSDVLFEEGVDFFDVFGHVDGDCVPGSALGGAKLGV